MSKIRNSGEWTYTQIPMDHEYRDKNGNADLHYLSSIIKINKTHTEIFEMALNSLSFDAPFKDYKISWKIEEIE
jgi:hypothetical protein